MKPRALIGLLVSLVAAALAGCCGGSALNSQAAAKSTDQYLEQVRNNPARLAAFVQQIPKGGDLHSHLSGIPTAEKYLAWASQDNMCINMSTWVISPAPCSAENRPVAKVLADSSQLTRAIDGLSMRSFPLAAPRYGHDQFFDAFNKFGAVSERRKADMLAEAGRRAASDNTDYLELLITIQSSPLKDLADAVTWNGDLESGYQALLPGIRGRLQAGSAEIDTLLADQRRILSCDGARPEPACRVTIRFIQQASRGASSQRVFASLIFGAELAARDPRMVSIDLVSPEDSPAALANYRTHMKMLELLKQKYPTIAISLHAGELTPALASQPDLSFHITEAVRTAGARRIGHGVSLKHEPGWRSLTSDMARDGIGVAILFTSNAQILGISGEEHPFRDYLDAGVPVMLATDDQGISRVSHSGEFQWAISTYDLNWPQVKRLARTSLEQAFIKGDSIWKERGNYSDFVEGCAADAPLAVTLSKQCDGYLQANPKAAEQWRHERRLAEFESRKWQ